MHGVTGVAGDLVETLSSADGLLDGILVIEDLVIWEESEGRKVNGCFYVESLVGEQRLTFHRHVDARGQEETTEAIVEDLVALQGGRGVVSDFNP